MVLLIYQKTSSGERLMTFFDNVLNAFLLVCIKALSSKIRMVNQVVLLRNLL